MLNFATKLLHKLLCLVCCYYTSCWQIILIANDHEWEWLWVLHHTLLNEQFPPVFYVVKGRFISYVVNEEAAVCASVKRCAQWLVPLLTRRVPYLQHHNLAINGNFLVAKVSAYRGLKIVRKSRMLKHLDERSFSNTRVANSDHLDKALLFAFLDLWRCGYK